MTENHPTHKTYAVRLQVPSLDIELQLRVQTPTMIGRSDSSSEFEPDVDLEPWEAHKSGVSRRHMMLIPIDDTLLAKDLGTVNGSRINGEVLQPHVVYPLADGDEITLGELVMNIRYHVVTPMSEWEDKRPASETKTTPLESALALDSGSHAPRPAPRLPDNLSIEEADTTIDDHVQHHSTSFDVDQYLEEMPDVRSAAKILKNIVINKEITPRMLVYISEHAVQHAEWKKNRRLAVLKTACDFGYVARDNAELMQAERVKNKYRIGYID